jgi:hypothetical protein
LLGLHGKFRRSEIASTAATMNVSNRKPRTYPRQKRLMQLAVPPRPEE